jgi:hypothetical protein
MCSVPIVVAAIGTALVSKKISDDAAKKKENAYKNQMKAAQNKADAEKAEFEKALEEQEKNPLLLGTGGQGSDYKSMEQLKVKQTVGGSSSLGMGGNTGVGLNV